MFIPKWVGIGVIGGYWQGKRVKWRQIVFERLCYWRVVELVTVSLAYSDFFYLIFYSPLFYFSFIIHHCQCTTFDSTASPFNVGRKETNRENKHKHLQQTSVYIQSSSYSSEKSGREKKLPLWFRQKYLFRPFAVR